MNILSLLLQLISGASAGSIVGSAFSSICFGTHRNVIIGSIGGLAGGHFLQHLCAGDSDATDMRIFLFSVVGGALGGSMLMLVSGLIKGIVTRNRK